MSNTAPRQKEDNQRSNQPTALIAGGAGFIGSHLVSTLVSQNFKVVCIDNFSTGKRENIREVLTSPNFTLIEADINDPNLTIPENLKIDYCFHLASIEDFYDKGLSLDTLLVNSLGTKQLLEIAKKHAAKFILVSAADLYSGAISNSSLRYYFGKTPYQEAILSAHEAKRFSEALAFEYYKKYKLPLTIIRLKDAYGPRMNLERGDPISDLLKNALAKETLTVPGDGLQVINPTFVSDIIFGLIKASVGDFNGEIFILVNPEKITVESFAQTVKLVAGPLELIHSQKDETFDFNSQHFDLENTKEKLSWKPKVTLAEGISSVLHQVQIEESKKELSEPTEDKASSAVEQIAVETVKPTKVGRNLRWLRLTLLLLATILLVLTVFYPLTAFAVNSVQAEAKLKESREQLLAENNEAAASESFAAQEGFQEASTNLRNLSWIVKIIGFSEESSAINKVYTASSSLSEAIRLSARANQILINSADDQNLTPVEARESLDEALTNLTTVSDRLAEARLTLEQVNWEEVSAKLTPEKDFLMETLNSLERQSSELIVTIEENLAKSEVSE